MEASLKQATIVGVDLAKRVFQLHGADCSGAAVFRKKLSRGGFRQFITKTAPCLFAMEACATAHYWARELRRLGHEVRLISPVFVKPFVKRQKTDAADAEAIVEAALRPSMRFVAPKSETQQTRTMLFRTRELHVGQRTQLINALRGHLAEFGHVFPQGTAHLRNIAELVADTTSALPEEARSLCQLYLTQIAQLDAIVADLSKKMASAAANSDVARRLQTMPGVGPVTALAVESFAPNLSCFTKGRDFAAWLGLTPREHSSGGKQRLGRVTRAGQRDIRRLLIVGATSVIRWVFRKNAEPDPWLVKMLKNKPRKLVAVALANKMARRLWAMATNGEDFRDPASVAR